MQHAAYRPCTRRCAWWHIQPATGVAYSRRPPFSRARRASEPNPNLPFRFVKQLLPLSGLRLNFLSSRHGCSFIPEGFVVLMQLVKQSHWQIFQRNCHPFRRNKVFRFQVSQIVGILIFLPWPPGKLANLISFTKGNRQLHVDPLHGPLVR